MKKTFTISLLITLFVSSVSAASFTNFIDQHESLQNRLEQVSAKITINSNALNSTEPNLRSLKKDLKKINKRHKKIYKSLVKKLKISKDSLESVKTRQKSMKFKRNDNELQVNLVNSYALASENNNYLEAMIEDNKATAYTDSQNSGLFGKISKITGNCMPTIGKTKTTCKESSFPTTVIVRKLTTMKDLEHFTYYAGSDEPLVNISTDDNGIYKLDLEAGEYSVFILDENNREYCDSYDGQGNACKVTITKDMYSEFNSSLDRAVY